MLARTVKSLTKRFGPDAYRWAKVARAGIGLFESGAAWAPRECNICGYKGKFYPAGLPWGPALRLDACCPNCDSFERHRLLQLWIDRNRRRIAGKSILHFAPEPSVTRFVRPEAGHYVTTDPDPSMKVDLRLDIENIALPDASFDVVICAHVLEHVDDRAALRGLRRIIKPGGLALIMIPMVDGWETTYENPAIVAPKDRELHFGQADHVRFYGRDVASRIVDAGFELVQFQASEPDISRYGLSRGETLFVASV